VWDDPGLNLISVSPVGVFCLSRQPQAIQPIWARVAYLYCTAHRSTQPSTLRRTVKWVSAFGTSNNDKWRWWMSTISSYTGWFRAHVVWCGLRVGGHTAISLQARNSLSNDVVKSPSVCMFKKRLHNVNLDRFLTITYLLTVSCSILVFVTVFLTWLCFIYVYDEDFLSVF